MSAQLSPVVRERSIESTCPRMRLISRHKLLLFFFQMTHLSFFLLYPTGVYYKGRTMGPCADARADPGG